jgi:hypothetical protein
MMILIKLVLFEQPLEHCIRIKNIFKQKNILVSEYQNVLWLTETKSIIIKSIKQSKLGNPVFIYALKQNSNLPLYCKSPLKQFRAEASRGQDWYQDNIYYPNYHAYRFIHRLQSHSFRLYSTIIKPLKNNKLTKELNRRVKNNQWITPSQKCLLISYIKKTQKTITSNYLIHSYLHSLLFHIYAIEFSNIPNKLHILKQLKKFYVKQNKELYWVIEQLFLLVLIPYKESKDKIILNLFNKLKKGDPIWYGTINCYDITYYHIPFSFKYKILLNNIIKTAYHKYKYLLFLDYILKDLEGVIQFGHEIIIINQSPCKVSEYLKVRGLYLSHCVKVNKSFNFMGYKFIIDDKIYIKPPSIKRKIKYILRSSYNLTSHELISKLNPIIQEWTRNCNHKKTLDAFKKFLIKRLKLYLIKKHKKFSIHFLLNQYTPLFYKWNQNLRKIFR